MSAVPLSILDLAPISSGMTAAEAYRNTVDLAVNAEQWGYRRYWVAEHHLTPGVASSVPALLIAQVAAATQRIRVGSGAMQMGHQTALSVVEQFGFLDALFPGRIDLGLGRSGQKRNQALKREAASERGSQPRREAQVVDGLLIPAPFSYAGLLTSPWFSVMASLLQQPGAQTPEFAEQVDDVLGLLQGTYKSPRGIAGHALPGEDAAVEVWIFGSSGGESAKVAGERGLRFAANYHVSPATVLDAVTAYRRAFQPSPSLAEPYVAVSADVVVADDDERARDLASPYSVWVRSIRRGEGAMQFPSPAEAAEHDWTDEDRRMVADRVDTQFVGSPATVAERLRVLQAATGADEIVVTTITHAHADRVRSCELLAREWGLTA